MQSNPNTELRKTTEIVATDESNSTKTLSEEQPGKKKRKRDVDDKSTNKKKPKPEKPHKNSKEDKGKFLI